MMRVSPFDLFGPDIDEDRDRSLGLMEAFSAFMRQRLADRSRGHDIRARSDAVPEHAPGFGPLLIFGGQIPIRCLEMVELKLFSMELLGLVLHGVMLVTIS